MEQLSPHLAPWLLNARTASDEHAKGLQGVRSQAVESLLYELLVEPCDELLLRPSNKFRASLVAIGAELSDADRRPIKLKRNLDICAEAIEKLHLGSLIIDDIQDGSAQRRGGPSLHTVKGTAQAISVGNWLYFKALRHLDWLEVPCETLQAMHRRWHEVMEIAHYGQVLDLSLSVDEVPATQLSEICYHCAYFKTGSVVSLAMVMGSLCAEASAERAEAVGEIGYALGVYLQQLNDIGNLTGSFDQDRRYEDLETLKPSFVWSFVNESYGSVAFARLLGACRALPDTSALEAWLGEHSLPEEAQAKAEENFGHALARVLTRQPQIELSSLLKLKERIRKAYA